MNNAVLLIQGIVEATPKGIVIPDATAIGEHNSIYLSKGEATFVSWSSGFIDYSGTMFEGVVENGSVSGAWVAYTGLGSPAGGVIAQVIPELATAQVIPEPKTVSLALLGLLIFTPKRRRV